jgi:single-stranded-DNA-specific exonuclease
MPTYSESSWKQKIPPHNIDVEKLIADWKLPPLYAVLLANRGIADLEEAKSFVNLTIHQLLDPFLMDGMQLAFERILTAIEQGERIMVYGDYDVDGTTGVSLFSLFLPQASDKV